MILSPRESDPSLVPVLSKVFETVIAIELTEHLTMTGVFSDFPYSYIRGQNTIHALE